MSDEETIKAKIQINIICPECGHVLMNDSSSLICVNNFCHSRIASYEIPEIDLVPNRWN